ncbi:MAG: hypothetical protein LBN39_01265 [Planctomycetaceae bacterium]|nr:hypothetical protein [Planctomycetaceae bacterium]
MPDSIDIGQENALRLLEQHGYIKTSFHTDIIETEITEPLRFVPLEPEYDEEDESDNDLFDTHSQLTEKGNQ